MDSAYSDPQLEQKLWEGVNFLDAVVDLFTPSCSLQPTASLVVCAQRDTYCAKATPSRSEDSTLESGGE
jgi:hypothetical protein